MISDGPIHGPNHISTTSRPIFFFLKTIHSPSYQNRKVEIFHKHDILPRNIPPKSFSAPSHCSNTPPFQSMNSSQFSITPFNRILASHSPPKLISSNLQPRLSQWVRTGHSLLKWSVWLNQFKSRSCNSSGRNMVRQEIMIRFYLLGIDWILSHLGLRTSWRDGTYNWSPHGAFRACLCWTSCKGSFQN